MEVLDVDRVMIAAPDATEAVERYEDLLGMSFTDIIQSEVEAGGEVQHNEVAYAEPGVELIGPVGEDTGVAQFIEDNGPGMFALVFRVADAEAAREELAEKGVEPIADENPEGVRELHYHPKDFGGVYTVLTAYSHPGFAHAE